MATGIILNVKGNIFVTAIQWEAFRWNQQISEMPLHMATSSDKNLVEVTTTLNKEDYHAEISFK